MTAGGHAPRLQRRGLLTKLLLLSCLEETPRQQQLPGGIRVKQYVSPANCTTLNQILKHKQEMYEMGKECIDSYIERNISSEMHKAIALQVFSTAISCWNKGILEAVQYASDVTGYSAYTIRKWA